MTDAHDLDTALVSQRVAAALALHVGDHRPLSRDMLAAATGFEPRTIQSHVLGQRTPCLSAFLTYARVLPVTFAASVIDLAGLVGARRREGAVTAGATLTEMAEGVAELAKALADGRIDHRERPDVVRQLREAIAAAEALVAQLEASALGGGSG